jgi:DNA polymerase-3 subunit epsilon
LICKKYIFVDDMYAIIDIETTGGSPKTDKITEIAVLIHDGHQIIKEFSTFINPECRIPHHISLLTGITDEMVANAPKFYEIARDLVEITEKTAFVAHNVSFDYNFIRSEFRRIGYDFKRDQLCTVRLSRKLIPGHRSYSLGRLCEELNIPVSGRHRAMGDALATAKLFDILLEINARGNHDLIGNLKDLYTESHPALDLSLFKRMPEEPGVYYFYNDQSELIYIGKSKNIKARVLSHFSNNSTIKAMQMRTEIAHIGWETTGSELIALLRESNEIKLHKPIYNRKQRRSFFQYGLFSNTDDKGYIRFQIEKTAGHEALPLVSFTTKAEARSFITSIINKFNLCQKLCGLYPSGNHCFHYEIGACNGACAGIESPEKYNLRAMQVIRRYKIGLQNIIIIDTGRHMDEKAAIKIENGKYIGFGYFAQQYAVNDPAIVDECIITYPDNNEIQQIISQYLRKNSVEKVIYF